MYMDTDGAFCPYSQSTLSVFVYVFRKLADTDQTEQYHRKMFVVNFSHHKVFNLNVKDT